VAVTARPPFSGYSSPSLGGGSGLLGSIAQFSDTTDQPVTTSPTVITFNTTDYASGGISIVAGSQLTVAATGTYRFDLSAQMLHTGGGTETITFWARINGVNVPNSASSIEMGNNNNRSLPYIPLLLPMTAGQYLEWVFRASTGTNIRVEAFPAVVGPPAVPAIPSVIAGVYRLA
jgi:hypothetical protein